MRVSEKNKTTETTAVIAALTNSLHSLAKSNDAAGLGCARASRWRRRLVEEKKMKFLLSS